MIQDQTPPADTSLETHCLVGLLSAFSCLYSTQDDMTYPNSQGLLQILNNGIHIKLKWLF
jgi:hypothetical protein